MWILKETLQFLFISRKRERGADTKLYRSSERQKMISSGRATYLVYTEHNILINCKIHLTRFNGPSCYCRDGINTPETLTSSAVDPCGL